MFLTKMKEARLKRTTLVKMIQKHKNIHLKYLDAYQFSKNTPLETWIRSNKLSKSKFVISHTSDVLRLLTLWKYGGTYLDLDVIVIKNLNSTNYACPESQNIVNGAIFSLDKQRGKEIVSLCIE